MSKQTSHTVNLLENSKFREFIDAFLELSKDAGNRSLEESRRLSTEFFLPPDTVYEPVHRIEDIEVPGIDGYRVPVRVYIPKEAKDLPTIIYFHRGGWVFGSVEGADPVCRKIANHLGCVVASVEYRLAPENPFPKPLNDCYSVTQWMSEHANRFGGNNKNLILFGESVGGNMVAAVTLMARDKKGPHISAQLLICPVMSSTINEKTYDECADCFFITQDSMQFFWSMYLQTPGDENNPYASPDKAVDFNGLPPALIVTAEHDPLRQEGEEYGRLLQQAGVKVVTKRIPGVIHGCIDLPIYEESQKIAWIKDIGNMLSGLVSHQ